MISVIPAHSIFSVFSFWQIQVLMSCKVVGLLNTLNNFNQTI